MKKLLDVYKNSLKLIYQDNKEEILEKEESCFEIEYTYNSCSLKGLNKVSLGDVKTCLLANDILNYSEREKKEILNHHKAYLYIKNLVKNNVQLTEEVLKDIHEILVEGIYNGGIYRNVNISILGASHQPTDYSKVYDRMYKMFLLVNECNNNPIEKAVYAHALLSKIHPFVDANGRLSRLVMNYYLLQAGYKGIYIPLSDKNKYFALLEIFKVEKDINPLLDYIENILEDRYSSLLKELEK
ncbi:MAG: Fic family protein [Acholeplasmatales bacterium]|jgi:Fic family protein|nr:Fic family protein [Acholeplasmatales bacterium]